MTPAQIKLVHIARRQVEKLSDGVFDEASYQMALRNCGVRPDAAGRCSSKQLTQAGFEKVLSLMEELGFRDKQGDEHWRNRNAARTGYATSRQVWEINQLAPASKYPLYAMCRRISNGQHGTPDKLTSAQAAKLIEALKAVAGRSQQARQTTAQEAGDATDAPLVPGKDVAQGSEGKDAHQNDSQLPDVW